MTCLKIAAVILIQNSSYFIVLRSAFISPCVLQPTYTRGTRRLTLQKTS